MPAFTDPPAPKKTEPVRVPPVPTPEQQSEAVKVAQHKANAAAFAATAERLANPSSAEIPPPLRVATLNGAEVVIARDPLGGPGRAGVAQIVSDDDLRAMDIAPDIFPECAFPGCKGVGRYQIISMSGKPLSVNRNGELVFGDLLPGVAEGLSGIDKARLGAGLRGVVGPSGVMPARLKPPPHVDVCLIHQTLPYGPQKPPAKRYESGPYPSYVSAAKRARDVEQRTGRDTMVRSASPDEYYVRGDDGHHGYKGKLVEIAR